MTDLNKFYQLLIFAFIAITLGCQSYNVTYETPTNKNNHVGVKDSGPKSSLSVDHIPDAVPVIEPRTKAGNTSPYSVNGKTYKVIENPSGFVQEGYASWYGNKFHGQKTSNGELYDMYGMTAAHKTLPLPTFVELTNLDNGRKVIVRVNDRGPFHGDRIIDLTYTAARKLGFANSGTGRVKLRVIDPDGSNVYQGLSDLQPVNVAQSVAMGIAPRPRNSGGYEIPEKTFLQLGAFSSQISAKNFMARAASLSTYAINLEFVPNSSIYRVLLGPVKDNWDIVHLQLHFVKNGYQEPKIVFR